MVNGTAPAPAAAVAEVMLDVSLPIATQTVVAVVTFLLLIFFLRKYMQGLASWEVCYVAVVEFTTYMIMLIAPKSSWVLKVGTDGQTFVWLRYASWLLTCPVLLQMISQVAHATIPNADFTTQTMMTFIFTAAMGVTSTLYRNPTIKWGAYVFGVISTVLTFGLIGFAWKKERLKMDPESLPARYELIALMCFTWSAFPLVFALSPESSGVLSQDSTIVIFAVLDLFCKNMYGYMSWYFNYCNAFSHRGTVLGIDRQNSLERLGRLEKRDKEKRKKKQDHDSDTTSPDTSDTDSEISSKDTDDNAKRRKPVDLEKANRSPRSVSAIDGTNGVDNSPSLALYPAARRPSAGGA